MLRSAAEKTLGAIEIAFHPRLFVLDSCRQVVCTREQLLSNISFFNAKVIDPSASGG
jgi:hypothetical protein